MSRIARQGVLLAAGTAISQVTLLIATIIVARIAGPAEFGELMSAIAIGLVAAALFDFGTNALWTRELARSKISLAEWSSAVNTKVIMSAGLGLVCCAAELLLDVRYLAAVGLISAGIVFSQSVQVGARAAGRADLIALGLILDRSVVLILVGIFWLFGMSTTTGLWVGLFSASILGGIVTTACTPAEFRLWPPKVSLRNPWRGATSFGIASASITLQNLDVPLVQLVAGAQTAGLVAAVRRWTQPMSLLANAFTVAAGPAVATSKNAIEAWDRIRRATWMLVGAIAICIAVAIASPTIVFVTMGDEYAASAEVLSIFAIGTILAIVNQPLVAALQFLGHERSVAVILAVGSCALVILVVSLTSLFGAIGAAYAFSLFQVIVLGLAIVVLSRVLRSKIG